MSKMDEASKMKAFLIDITKEIIGKETNACMRLYKAVVVTAPNPTTNLIGVKRIGDYTTLNIPYTSAVSEVTTGKVIWIMQAYGTRNAIAWLPYDMDIPLGLQSSLKSYLKGEYDKTINRLRLPLGNTSTSLNVTYTVIDYNTVRFSGNKTTGISSATIIPTERFATMFNVGDVLTLTQSKTFARSSTQGACGLRIIEYPSSGGSFIYSAYLNSSPSATITVSPNSTYAIQAFCPSGWTGSIDDSISFMISKGSEAQAIQPFYGKTLHETASPLYFSNRNISPASIESIGGSWQSLGTFTISGSTIYAWLKL